MKKALPVLIIASLLLSACGILNNPPANPTPSDEQLATRVAGILTQMPPTEAPVVEPTVELPTPPPTATQVPPTETEIPPADTATPEPTATESLPTATATVEITGDVSQAGGGGPSGTVVSDVAGTISPPTPTPPATSTLSPTDPRVKQGPPDFVDTMDNANNWPSGVDRAGFTSVAFTNGQMQLTGLKTRSGWRLSRYGTDLRDFFIDMRVSTTECKGEDRYGIYFHVPQPTKPDQGYWFGFKCDGSYALQQWDALEGPEGTVTNLIYWTKNSAINAGSFQTNRMSVISINGHVWLYANGIPLGQRDTTAWPQGAFGVFVGARETKNMSIQVDEISVWTRPSVP